jgi:hypothetical protein
MSVVVTCIKFDSGGIAEHLRTFSEDHCQEQQLIIDPIKHWFPCNGKKTGISETVSERSTSDGRFR